MKEILNIIHKTIYQFFDACEDDAPMSDKDKLLLEVNKAICNNLKAVEKQPCESIKEIPKDYKYDTETEDFLVYRHMYTGHEIHIEKPAPRYKLEQQSCDDCISRQAVIDWIKTRLYQTALNNDEYITSYAKVCEDIAENRIDTWVNEVKSVESERKPGKWIEGEKTPGYIKWSCSECGMLCRNPQKPWYKFCPSCGAKMEV